MQDVSLAHEPADLRDPELYLNRELTWLEFNKRVLAEGEDPRTPLLERVKFLAIVGNNLDEFFMKRIGGLKQQVGAGLARLTVDGRTPAQQIRESYEIVRELEHRMESLADALETELERNNVFLEHIEELGSDERNALRELFRRDFFPLITPQAVDPAHPFPFISNLSLNLLVSVRRSNDQQSSLVRVKVPIGRAFPRFVRVPGDRRRYRFVVMEDLIAANLDLLFPRMEIVACERFRVTRNAITEKDEEQAEDLLALIESELRERKFAPIVRLEIEATMKPLHRRLLARALGLDRRTDVFEKPGLMAYRDWFELAALPLPDLRYPVHEPVEPSVFSQASLLFDVIRQRDVLVHHPYESFAASVERFVREASRDPKVMAIKMTLYRTSEDTQIIDALIQAARNDKQVAVVVELKARFDESANIRWANRLEEVGIHVTYGVVGFKTHCKVVYVLRQEGDGLQRYAHIGTGNYHAGTAKLYTDLGLFTADPEITEDLTELFNFLTTGFVHDRDYERLLVSPEMLKAALIQKIEREIEHVQAGRDGALQFKMNALEDADVTHALYRASQAGVKVELIVRDTCRFRPGLPGISEGARVFSIVGRFLEHARIYYFRNDGDEEYFIGSADAMKRNLESRVEVVVPVLDDSARGRLRRLLDLQLADTRGGWEMQPDGSYVRRGEADSQAQSSQEKLTQIVRARMEAERKTHRHQMRSLPGDGRRNN